MKRKTEKETGKDLKNIIKITRNESKKINEDWYRELSEEEEEEEEEEKRNRAFKKLTQEYVWWRQTKTKRL